MKRQKLQYAAPVLICIKIVSISSSNGAMQSFQFYESPAPNSRFHFWNKLDLPWCFGDTLVLCILFEWQNKITFCVELGFFSLQSKLLLYCFLLRGIYRQIYSNYLLSAAGELVDILLYIPPPGAISASDVACSA